MENNYNQSKVALCPKCGCFVLACDISTISHETEQEFTELTNEGFIVILERKNETQERKFSLYSDCAGGKCEAL